MGKKSLFIANIIAILALILIAYSILKNDGNVAAIKTNFAAMQAKAKGAIPSHATAKPITPAKKVVTAEPVKQAVTTKQVELKKQAAAEAEPAVEVKPTTPAESESAQVALSQPSTDTQQNETAEPAPEPPIRVLLVPEKETTISSTTAARINQLNGSLGQSFKSGQILIAFDCKEEAARISMSKAELSSKIDQHEAKVRMQGLQQASDVEVSMAASEANRARAELSLHRAQARKCKIHAPWAGRIAKVYAKNYMTVSPGEPLMDLVKSGPLKLKLNIPSTALAHIKQGSTFNVTIDETSKTYDAKVTAINSRVDSISQTVEIEARLLANHAELLAGMSGISYLVSFN